MKEFRLFSMDVVQNWVTSQNVTNVRERESEGKTCGPGCECISCKNAAFNGTLMMAP